MLASGPPPATSRTAGARFSGAPGIESGALLYYGAVALRDMSEKVCVVTGANTGIGRVTAVDLARRGARVVFACRSQERARDAMDEARAAGAADRVDFVALDLVELRSVRRAANELLERGHPIHVLVANAGLAGSRGATADGFELAFGVNHLGHFLFVELLRQRLVESAPARIVLVSSQSHYSAKRVDWDAVRRPTRSITGLREYAVSKLANVLHGAELARRLEGTGVTSYSLHPGVIASDVWRRVPWPVRPAIKAFMKTNEEGAQTSIHCATAPELATETGLYYTDSRPKKPSALARDPALAAELWQRSAAWTDIG